MGVKTKTSQYNYEVTRYGRADNAVNDKSTRSFTISRALEIAEREGLRNGHALSVTCEKPFVGREVSEYGLFSSVDSVDFSASGIVNEEQNSKNTGTRPFDFGGLIKIKYDAVFVYSVLEYLERSFKKELIDSVSEAVKDGGMLVLSFPRGLPENFLEERLNYQTKLKEQPFVAMFRDSDKQRPKKLDFESGLVEEFKARGWKVLDQINSIGERNFVEVANTFVVLQKLTA